MGMCYSFCGLYTEKVEKYYKTLYFYHNFNKKYLKIATPDSLLTVLAENLHKGTSQGCKKFDGGTFLNFRFFCYL